MHEAQTPDDGAYIQNLNSVDSPQSSKETTNPFNSILTGENKARELFLLAPFSEEPPPNQAVNSSQEEEVAEHIDTTVEIIIDSQLHRSSQLDEETDLENDWVAEPDAEQQAIVNSEFDKLLELNEELRSANNKLYEQVEELTNALSDSEVALERQKKRSNVAESILKQQTQELTAAQAQIQSLFEQLENALQNVQRHESVAESYKAHLEFNQQRLAQLERECVLIQTNYREQSQLLSQSENACRELRTRLKRQQRQTLQFKAALEKSLETSIPGYDTLDECDSSFPDIRTSSQVNKSKQNQTISSIQPIQPWSATPDSNTAQNYLWEDILTTSPTNESENPIEEESNSWEFSANSDIAPIENTSYTQTEDSVSDDFINHDLADEEATRNQVVSPSDLLELEQNFDNVVVTPSDSSELEQNFDSVVVTPSDSSELEQQLDSVIQTFFASQTESASPQSQGNEDASNNENTIPTWNTVIEPVETNNHDNVENYQNLDPEDEHVVSFNSSINENYTDETEDYWEEVSHFPAYELSENASSFEMLSDTDHDTNSPSPLIYPKRPPKGRKSFASVELPNFPQKNDEDKG